MVPKISVDTTNLDVARNEGSLSPVNQHEMSPITSDTEKQSHLLVPAHQGQRHPNTSDAASNGWEASTANDNNEKGRFEAIQHGHGILNEFEPEDTGSFAFTNKQLQALVDPKDLELLRQMGGLPGLCKGLHTDAATGLSWDETRIPVKVTLAEAQAAGTQKSGHGQEQPVSFSTPPPPAGTLSKRPTFGGLKKTITARSTMKAGEDKMLDRKAIYGTNVLPARKTKNIFQLMWIALQDKVLIILSVAAVVSLALGLYETFDGPPEIDPLTGEAAPHIEWVEGVAIIVAIAIVTVVGSANDYQKERQFAKLNKKVCHIDTRLSANNLHSFRKRIAKSRLYDLVEFHECLSLIPLLEMSCSSNPVTSCQLTGFLSLVITSDVTSLPLLESPIPLKRRPQRSLSS